MAQPPLSIVSTSKAKEYATITLQLPSSVATSTGIDINTAMLIQLICKKLPKNVQLGNSSQMTDTEDNNVITAITNFLDTAIKNQYKKESTAIKREGIQKYLKIVCGNIDNAGYTKAVTALIGSTIDGSSARKFYESSPIPGQCNNTIGPFPSGSLCYICLNPMKNTAQCEHILPILDAMRYLRLYQINGRKKFAYHAIERDLLKLEYRWAHACCNLIKKAEQWLLLHLNAVTRILECIINTDNIQKSVTSIANNVKIRNPSQGCTDITQSAHHAIRSQNNVNRIASKFVNPCKIVVDAQINAIIDMIGKKKIIPKFNILPSNKKQRVGGIIFKYFSNAMTVVKISKPLLPATIAAAKAFAKKTKKTKGGEMKDGEMKGGEIIPTTVIPVLNNIISLICLLQNLSLNYEMQSNRINPPIPSIKEHIIKLLTSIIENTYDRKTSDAYYEDEKKKYIEDDANFEERKNNDNSYIENATHNFQSRAFSVNNIAVNNPMPEINQDTLGRAHDEPHVIVNPNEFMKDDMTIEGNSAEDFFNIYSDMYAYKRNMADEIDELKQINNTARSLILPAVSALNQYITDHMRDNMNLDELNSIIMSINTTILAIFNKAITIILTSLNEDMPSLIPYDPIKLHKILNRKRIKKLRKSPNNMFFTSKKTGPKTLHNKIFSTRKKTGPKTFHTRKKTGSKTSPTLKKMRYHGIYPGMYPTRKTKRHINS